MKIYFALLLITLVFGHGLQVVEEKIEEEDRRELLAITGAAILAACISGVVGGITGAVATRGIDACGGRRDKTVVIIRDESGEYRQKDTRRLLMGAKAAGEVNGNGVSFEGSHTCPENPENVVVALQRNVKDDGTAYFTIPNQFFEADAYSKVDAKQQEYFKKITTKTLPYSSNSIPSKKSTNWRPRTVLEIPAIQSLKSMLGLRRPDPSSRS